MLAALRLAGALADETTDCGLQIFWRTRFREHRIASGAARSLRIRRKRRVACDGKHRDIACTRVALEPARQLEAVDPRNVEVGDDDVRAGIKCPLERLQPVMSLIDPEASLTQPVGVHTPTIEIVFDKEHNRNCRRPDHWSLPDQYKVPWSREANDPLKQQS